MLELAHIHKRFGRKTVARDISLTVANGRLTAVLGRSGCGKSTLLNIAAGLVQPESGSVIINGRDVGRLPPEKRRVSLMFQDYALFPHLNVWQNTAFALTLRGMPSEKARRTAETLLAEVGLEGQGGRRVESLSGGEQQRVALARALAAKPELLLLDEPFSSLDTGLRRSLRALTLAQIRRQNIPAVLVTHDPEEAFLMADHIALMSDGAIIQHGTPSEIARQPASAQAARLLALSNVSDTRYLPQAALSIAANGTLCPVVQREILPEHSRFTVQHSEYGEMVLDLNAAQAAEYA
ncbi:MAG: ABC transporter ATP-binding protein, partial [Neisseria sp.]|nr:ABC transporter ATP-binding protein [Neisseria sp.]